MSPSATVPLVVEHADALGVCNGREVKASVIPSAAAILVARGGSQMLVPAPGSYERERAEEGIERLPPERRGLVRLVDQDAAILRRVREFVSPMRVQASKWPEDAFVACCEAFLYQLAVGARFRAGVLDSSVETVREFVPIIDPTCFFGEARFRLAEIVSLVCAYEPAISAQGTVAPDVAAVTRSSGVWDILDLAEFRSLVAASGRLGYLRRPDLALKRLRRSVERLIALPGTKGLLRLGKAAAEVGGASQVATGVAGVVDTLGGGASGGYWPPFIGLGPAALAVFRIALTEAYPRATPSPGSIMAFEHIRFGRKSTSWLNSGDEGKLEREATEGLAHRTQRTAAAREAQQRFFQA